MNHYKTHKKKDKIIHPKVISSELFRNENGAIDLASIMVGIIVIGLIGGVIAATVFAVIPWSQDNAAKQQLDSLVSAESAYFGLSADNPPALPEGAKTNSFGNSTELASANLMGTGPNYCVVTPANGATYTAYSKSASGAIFQATDKNSKAEPFSGSIPDPLPADCQFLAGGTTSLPTSPPTVDNFANLTFTSKGDSFRGMAVSADGTKMIAGDSYYAHLMLSTDSGKTWVKKLDSSASGGFAFNEYGISADGTKMITTGYAGTNPGSVWVSTNSGASWTKVIMGSTGTYGSNSYRNPKISADGTTMTVYDIYTYTTSISTNNGATWSTIGTRLPVSAMSPDGKTIIGGATTSTVYLRTNGGAFVLQPPLGGLANISLRGISMSSDGKDMLAVTTGTSFLVSNDAGLTWTEHTELGNSPRVGTVSNDGTKMLLNTNTGTYLSKDSGKSWTLTSAPVKPFATIQFSPDSSKIYAADATFYGPWWLGTFSP
jgi:type II secretory pathway pseudopilin PulG